MSMFATVADAATTALANSPAPQAYDLTTTYAQSLTVSLDTQMLFDGAQLMIDALGGPYMLIAGFGLGVAILGAVFGAVTRIRL